jgi:hypothetical protein
MALWNKVQAELDKAGKVARAVVDEGKLRLDAYRGREQADKAAEALGYAVFRAEEAGGTLDPAVREQLMNCAIATPRPVDWRPRWPICGRRHPPSRPPPLHHPFHNVHPPTP